MVNKVEGGYTESPEQLDPLATWVMANVNKWREHRDSNFLSRWAEYYRLWRGFWNPQDQNKEAERAKLIAPALQQAVDMTVSEMEEATFGRGVWFDVSDDYADQEKDDATHLRDQLLCDFEENDVPGAVTESYLSGALYGNGIAKVMIGTRTEIESVGGGETQEVEKFRVWLEPILPYNFVIDPGSRGIDDALGCAHEMTIPRHKVLKRIRDGFYYDKYVGSWDGTDQGFSEQGSVLTKDSDSSDTVFITEYHGLVPEYLLNPSEDTPKVMPGELEDDEKFPSDNNEGAMVEAIITIANKGILLRAVENPYLMKDRAIVAYPHDTVPGRFWGRGVSEKGYNPQKALDAELRARIDSLAYLTYPTVGADATRLPRGLDLKIKPGRMFLTNGRPSEIIEPIVFGNLNPATFDQAGDLERMVQMGTGAMDSASPLESNRRNETMGGMSMIQSGFIKRSKRAMRNVETKFLDKIVQKALWRYMQFDPERYPQDFKFQVNSTMGIMAREFEQQVLTQMLQVIPPESPIFPAVVKGIIENSAAVNKSELVDAVKTMMQPNPQAEQMKQIMAQLQVQQLQGEVAKLNAEAELARSQAIKAQAEAQLSVVKAHLEDEQIEVSTAQTVIADKKNKVEQFKAQLQAVTTAQELSMERERMDHEKEMAKYDLSNQQELHNQKVEHNEQSHQQKMRHSDESAQQKAKQVKQKPKGK